MAQILHGRARTTEATRKIIQNSKESLAKLAKRFGINIKTVAKWKKRSYTHDTQMGPKKPRSTVLSAAEESAILVFRKKTLLPLDDCLYALREAIPHLTRSSLYRCLKRHGFNKLPKTTKKDVKTPAKKQFKSYPPGYVHVDITHIRIGKEPLYLFVAIDRTTKFAYAKLYERENRDNAADFLKKLISEFPYPIKIILTDNGIQFTNRAKDKRALKTPFSRICEENSIDHRQTQVAHPWTNGQVERMNRVIKEATVSKYHYVNKEELERHLASFMTTYNLAKRLKTLKGKTPLESALAYCRDELKLSEETLYHYNLKPYT